VLVVALVSLQARQSCSSNATRCALLLHDSSGPVILFGVFLNEDAKRLSPPTLPQSDRNVKIEYILDLLCFVVLSEPCAVGFWLHPSGETGWIERETCERNLGTVAPWCQDPQS
jgi:hypothetical protein